MEFKREIKKYAEAPILRHQLLDLLHDYQSPNDKISELLKSKTLISLRRGLYMVGTSLDLPQPEPFLIANHLRGPSYVSLESALSYWNMIPERVFEVSSMCINSSKVYNTKAGRFSYHKLKLPYYSFGIKNIQFSSKQSFLIASPEKSLCDKVVLTPNLNLRSVKQTRAFLLEDLRIEKADLRNLDTSKMKLWIDHAPKKSSIEMLIKTLIEL